MSGTNRYKFPMAGLLCGILALALMLLAAPLPAQTAKSDSDQNAHQARAILDAMVKALGGEAWLNRKNETVQGRESSYFQGQPASGSTDYWESHAWPDQDRIEYSRHRDVVQFYLGRAGWEVTFKGKAPLPQEQVDDFLRRRDHSIEIVVRQWLNDPKTMLIYGGQQLLERRQADQVVVLSAGNDAVTILIDTETHLPLSRSYEWRDPVFKDRNLDDEEYDSYQTVDGIATPFSITRFKNGEVTRQFFLLRVSYNRELPPDQWSVDSVVSRLRK